MKESETRQNTDAKFCPPSNLWNKNRTRIEWNKMGKLLMATIFLYRWSHLTHPLSAPHPSIITGNESEQSNWLHSLTFFSSPLLELSIWHRVPMFMHLLRLLAGLSEKKEGLFFFLFSPFLFFFFYAISCLQKPLMPIQHQHQGTALMSILAADLFLSPLPAAPSVSLLPSIPPFIPSSSPRSALYGYCTIK